MKQLQEGLFVVEDTMPCNPRDIRIERYALPSTLQRAEREEAAARILTFSQQLDSWVGVSWQRLSQMMQEEFEGYQQWKDALRDKIQEESRFNAATRKYRKLCNVTLGVYALFATKPKKQLLEVPKFQVPFSGIFTFGPGYIVEGINELVGSGMLKHVVQEGKRPDARDIYFPTPMLISKIMQKQGRATA